MEGNAVADQPDQPDQPGQSGQPSSTQPEAEGPRTRRSLRPRRSSRPRRRAVWIAAAAVLAAVVVAALLWTNCPKTGAEPVTLGGVEYTSNVRMEEQGGYVYAYIPVNSDAGGVVIEVADAEDNREIREFLDSLDTLVPGEHVLALSESNLHIIVDGMSEG